MKAYLVCFDISDDDIRYHVAKELGSYGDRVQMSVFEITVNTSPQFDSLKTKLAAMLAPGDKLYFYHICLNCRKKSVDADDTLLMQFPAAIVL